jgi:hypothetical protein
MTRERRPERLHFVERKCKSDVCFGFEVGRKACCGFREGKSQKVGIGYLDLVWLAPTWNRSYQFRFVGCYVSRQVEDDIKACPAGGLIAPYRGRSEYIYVLVNATKIDLFIFEIRLRVRKTSKKMFIQVATTPSVGTQSERI